MDNTGNNGSMSTVRVGSRSLPLYPVVIVCLGLLNTILMLAAIVIGIYCGKVIEKPTPHQATIQGLIIEVKQLQVMQTEVIKAQEEAQQGLQKELRSHQQLKLQLEQNTTLGDGVQRKLEILQVERATLLSNSSHIRDSCGRCQSGWLLFNTSCYFHSKSASDTLKNWHDSRADCIRRGGDLAVINNLEEQVNLFEFLPKLDKSIRPWWIKPGGTWIGISDIQAERNWVWINNVTLQDPGQGVCGWNIVWPPSVLPTYGAPTHPNDQGAAGTGGTVGGRAPFSCTHQQQCSATELLSICSHELLARNYSVTIRRRVKSFSEYL